MKAFRASKGFSGQGAIKRNSAIREDISSGSDLTGESELSKNAGQESADEEEEEGVLGQVQQIISKSDKTSRMLRQLTQERSSIINQGEMFIQRRNMKEAIMRSQFDTQKQIPTQIWYDQLRESDDGTFSNLSPRCGGESPEPKSTLHKRIFRNRGKQDPRPFNSQSRVFYHPIGVGTNALSTSMKIYRNHKECSTHRSHNEPFLDYSEEQKSGFKSSFESRHKSLTNASKVSKPKEK